MARGLYPDKFGADRAAACNVALLVCDGVEPPGQPGLLPAGCIPVNDAFGRSLVQRTRRNLQREASLLNVVLHQRRLKLLDGGPQGGLQRSIAQ